MWRYAMGVHGSGKENSPSAPAGTRTRNIRLRVRRFIHSTIPYTLSCGVLLLRTGDLHLVYRNLRLRKPCCALCGNLQSVFHNLCSRKTCSCILFTEICHGCTTTHALVYSVCSGRTVIDETFLQNQGQTRTYTKCNELLPLYRKTPSAN